MGVLVDKRGYRTPLGRWLYQRRQRVKWRWWNFTEAVDRRWCMLGVSLGVRNPQACRTCGRTDLDGWDPTGAETWCEDHCPDHDYKSDSMRSGRWCIHCGKAEPWD
jgi:hypothetical protein